MANVTEYGVLVFIACLTALIVYMIMNQRMESKIIEAEMNAKIMLAGIEEKETALKGSFENYDEQMKDSFTLLAKAAFEDVIAAADAQKTTTFNEATESLEKSLKEYSENMNKIEAQSLERGTRLEERINTVSELGMQLSDQTNNLTRALKADSQAQGAWGELVLENLLQSLGFEKGRDYLSQKTYSQEDGTMPRTDFIINLPENRQIVIDSKVSLTAWERYVNAKDDHEMDAAMKDHCLSILNHAKGLASKNYQGIEQLNTVDFVLMYVPLESAFSAAMKMHPDLYMEFAKDNHVRVVTGSTIVTTLMLIKEIWKREVQTKNQQKLIIDTGKLHDKIVGFIEAFEVVGTELTQASNAYNLAFDRLSQGRANIIKQTDGLKKLGAKVTKEINSNLLESANHSHENSSKE